MDILTDDWNREGWRTIVPDPYPDTPKSQEDVEHIVSEMRGFFSLGVTRSVEFRVRQLRRLKTYLRSHENEIFASLKRDLGKPAFESYATELGLVYEEIDYCVMHTYRWSQVRVRRTHPALLPARSFIAPEPLGVALIMAPWNYPLQLVLIPLVDAICAGNCVALKPSRKSAATSRFIAKLCYELFDPRYIFCFPGGDEMNDWLLKVRFDKLFFTGSPRVGRIVMHAAADHLCDVTLELGGKNPCIVDRTANVRRAAQRIAWGKCINAGQTCVAPDYLLVHESVVVDFLAYLEYYLHVQYGNDILASKDYPHLIDRDHFDRVCRLIDEHGPDAQVIIGGGRDAETLKIEPTALYGVTEEDPIMQEEVFGPVFPIITYRSLAKALEIVQNHENPLACYVFSDDSLTQNRLMRELPFGGGCINDVVVHIANNHLPFGGVGQSGIGSYHGKAGFECFTHFKPILKRPSLPEPPLRTPPYAGKMGILRLFMH
jgi:aldehyde dehydrogenase (NAD+)